VLPPCLERRGSQSADVEGVKIRVVMEMLANPTFGIRPTHIASDSNQPSKEVTSQHLMQSNAPPPVEQVKPEYDLPGKVQLRGISPGSSFSDAEDSPCKIAGCPRTEQGPTARIRVLACGEFNQFSLMVVEIGYLRRLKKLFRASKSSEKLFCHHQRLDWHCRL